MRHFYLLVFFSLILEFANSQTISPAFTDEYCPNTEYTFTATIPKTYQSMIGVSGAAVTQLPTSPVGNTFTFKGKFGDVNQKQAFRVYYSDNTFYNFEFKKIKSLFYSTSCAQVPNQATVTVPRCQIVNIPITVPNLRWETAFESPTLCFGSISTFEYQLPTGWSVGTNVSNGSNWIAGGNSVTVTSDLSNGVNGVILVRPRNTCGTGMQNGQTPGQIPISRPEPTLTITGSQDYICNGSSATYTISGVPGGATVQWSVSNTSEATITAGGNTNTVTVTKTGTGNTTITLTATVTHCSPFVYTRTYDISLGLPQPNPIVEVLVDPYIGKIQVESTPALPGATYNWYKDGVQVIGQHGSFATIPIRKNVCAVGYGIEAEAINGCGTSARTYKGVYVPPCDGYYAAFPNPASSEVTVAKNEKSKNTDAKPIEIVRVYDLQGNLKKQQKYSRVRSVGLNVSQLPDGMYYVEVVSGTYKERIQLLIRK
ncbi:MAG: T9SS type A sorting domain-containing protein [Daejeonella sp.]